MIGSIILVIFISSCGPEMPTRIPTAQVILLTPPPTPPVTKNAPVTTVPTVPIATVTPIPTPVPVKNPDFFIGAKPGVPAELIDSAMRLSRMDPQRFSWQDGESFDGDTIILSVSDGVPFAQWVYVVVAPFATVADEITLEEIMNGWQTGNNKLGSLILDHDTVLAFTSKWGPPATDVQIVQTAELVDSLWSNRPSWSIIPFNQLSPELKVLSVNGQSPLARDYDATNYPLKVEIGIDGDGDGVSQLRAAWSDPVTNRDPGKLTRVAMTGVTALGRATAYQMEIGGILTPGLVVAPIMQAADIAHISHEIPFAPDCPYPNPIGDPIFCARDSYMALIESIGTDVVELTGNHVNDWGPENMSHSMDLYETANLKTFGGGRNLDQAIEPAIFEHNGNRIAFVGCNPVGPAYAWATDNQAGSRPCDFTSFYQQIRELRDSGYQVIATLQYSEFYHYEATPQQQADFRALVDAGAVAVSGSQGHHAQGFDFKDGAFIHFGLGNLFFDQMDMLGTRQSFIDTYVFYDGRLVSVELYTSLIENYCCPRNMTDAERAQLLDTVFQASGW